jgi:hypothetical protein
VSGVHLFSTGVTTTRPRLYSLSAQCGSSLSPTAEGHRMYHPTLSSAVTRRIWGSPDAILLFFAGGAAEFAAIKAVDWLFFTGRLPGAPVERFFETVRFAQSVFFGDPAEATDAVERINRIHRGVEDAQGEEIPQWAYRDMLFILIDYGERAHEVVFGPARTAALASSTRHTLWIAGTTRRSTATCRSSDWQRRPSTSGRSEAGRPRGGV